MTLMRRITAIFTILLLSSSFIWGLTLRERESPLNYFKKERKQDYKFALSEAREILSELKTQDYPYAMEAASIVFPELMRYRSFQNEIESLFNEVLAVTTEESDGFSIGEFQMKPVFAIQVEKIISLNPQLRQKYGAVSFGGDVSTVQARRDRVMRLNDKTLQLEYLKAFIDYEVEVLSLASEDLNSRISYLSAAYNFGISQDRKYLERAFNMETFPSGKRRLYFNYQKICLDAAVELGREVKKK